VFLEGAFAKEIIEDDDINAIIKILYDNVKEKYNTYDIFFKQLDSDHNGLLSR